MPCPHSELFCGTVQRGCPLHVHSLAVQQRNVTAKARNCLCSKGMSLRRRGIVCASKECHCEGEELSVKAMHFTVKAEKVTAKAIVNVRYSSQFVLLGHRIQDP